MFQLIVLLALGAGAFYMFSNAFGGDYKQKQLEVEEGNYANLTIKDARKGDVILVEGSGVDYEDLSFDVDRRNRYESRGDAWYELSGKYRGKRVFLEWQDDDELEVWLDKNEVDLTLRDLGISEADLERYDQEESRRNTVTYNGSDWPYDGSKEVGYFEDDRGEGEGFYVWEFMAPNDRSQIYVEKWPGEPFDIGVVERVAPEMVRVLRRS